MHENSWVFTEAIHFFSSTLRWNKIISIYKLPSKEKMNIQILQKHSISQIFSQLLSVFPVYN